MWMVRAGEHGRFFSEFKKKKIVAIGFNKIGDLSKTQNPDEIKRMVDQEYTDETPGNRIMSASQISRFRFDFKEEDNVVTYNPDERVYLIGKIKGPYKWGPSRSEYKHVRNVEWKGNVSRDAL